MVKTMSDLLLEVVNHLRDRGIIEGDGIDAFRDFMPEAPDNAVVIYEYPGSPTVLHEEAVHRSLQCVVRDKSPTSARQLCNKIFSELCPIDRYKELSSGRWCMIYARQTPFKLKSDDKERVSYCFNMGITTYRD
jgi:hypothetical protein